MKEEKKVVTEKDKEEWMEQGGKIEIKGRRMNEGREGGMLE